VRVPDEVFDITAEVRQLARVKKIQDELAIILRVLNDQKEVLIAMTAELKELDSKKRPPKDEVESKIVDANIRDFEKMKTHADVVHEVESTYRQRYQMVDTNIRDFEKMKTHADVVHDEVRDPVAVPQCSELMFPPPA